MIEASKKESIRNPKIHSKAVRFGIFTGFTIIFLGVMFLSFQAYMKDRIFPFVKVQDVSVGGLKSADALAKLETYYPSSKSLIFTLNGEKKDIPADKIDAKIDLSTAVTQAYKVGRGRDWTNPITLTSTINKDKLRKELVDVFSFKATDPKDASYGLTEDNKLNINPGQDSVDLNIILTGQLIENRLINTQFDGPIPITLKKKPPTITTDNLELIKAQAEQYINKPDSILINGHLYTPKIDQKLTFIQVGMENEQPTIGINDDNVRSYIDSVSKKVAVTSKPDLYLANGDLSEAGLAGAMLDKDVAFTQYKEAILDHKDSPVTLVTTTIPPKRSVIEQPSTPGQFEGKYIEVDLSSQQLFQYEGDSLIGTHRISSGKSSTPTPTGTYSINFKHPRAFSGMYKLYMPYWMAFIGSKYGIHELPEWPGGKKEGERNIGRAVSAGCIRLGVGDAKEVYDWAEVGTKVIIHQ